ncbi:MAG TPA: amidohydrolase family protein [Steroidobacteraceae bacterium]|nr:amidohydrolase family protein [Steroidobacteraceae bacterium]
MRNLCFALCLVVAQAALAQEPEDVLPFLAQSSEASQAAGDETFPGPRPRQPAGQTLPLKPTRHIAFDTDEGTWMSVDLSPDGRQIVFDLLGDLYTLDVSGGHARAITHGLPFDSQPTYSPDGRWIAFLSDRSGAENVWLVHPDGTQPRQISFGDDDTVLVSPTWSPDGKSLYVSRFSWSVDNYELWRYDLDGKETLVVPVRSAGQARSNGIGTLGAVVSPDGRELYFARRTGTSDGGDWSIVRRDIASGAEETLLPEPGGPSKKGWPIPYFRPVLSPDGKWLAYATRVEGRTGLRLRELATGDDRWLAFPIQHDQMQAQSWQDLVPRYTFTRDGTALILSCNGKLERLAISGGAPTQIPFTASVDIELGPLTRVAIKQDTGPVRARLIQTPEQSPDGKQLAFSALGHVYVMPLDGRSKPHRLTSFETPEFHPSWSPDGREIVFITWTAKEAGQIWMAPAAGNTPPKQLTTGPAFYTRPVFTRDGKSVLAVRSSNRGRLNLVMEFGQVRDAELIELPLPTGAARVVYSGRLGGKPHFGPSNDTVYVLTANGLTAVDLESGVTKPAVEVRGPGWYFMDRTAVADDSRISPDGRWVLALIAQQLHVVQAPPPGQPLDLSRPGVQHRRITDVGADFFEWADGGKTITWAVGSTFYRRSFADVHLNPADRPSWTADPPRVGHGTKAFEAVVTVPRDVAKGTLLLHGARAVTMRGDEVIENSDILVRDSRIVAAGPAGSLRVPADATVRDVSGKTILPGFIDVHDHVADIRRDVLTLQPWGFAARLADGVTTSFDPSTLSIDMFAYQDLNDAGLITGSRVPSTGTALFSYNRIASIEDARAVLRRYRDHYRTHNIKEYLIGNRRQREWLAQAAAEMGMMPTTEGSLSLKLDLTQIMDGYSGNEHSLATQLYRDVIELVARSRTSYDATLQIANGGPAAQDDFVAHDRPLTDPKFMRFRPYSVAAQEALTRPWTDPMTMLYPTIGGDLGRIQRAGGVVAVGSHGEIPGVGFHWEMEAYVQGGMTPLEALRAGTIGGAEAIGRAAEFGSIEAGKFADLVILNEDPRTDIRKSRALAAVMKNGRLYDANTLDELWPRNVPFPVQWFADERPSSR